MKTVGFFYADPGTLRAAFRVVDLDGTPKTGLVAGDFTITVLYKSDLEGIPGAYSTTVTVTEENSTNLPGWYTFEFTPTDRGRFFVEVTPTFSGAARGVLSQMLDNRGYRPELPAIYLVIAEDDGNRWFIPALTVPA